MKKNQIILIATVFSIVAGSFDVEAKQEKEMLKIYLPREITAESSTPTLGQVAVVRGSESLVAKASEITVGNIASADQNIVVTRNIVLSRLASNGIPASRVALSGAEETCVKRQHQRMTGSQFVQEATAFLKNNLPDKTICQLDATRIPEDLILSHAPEDVKLTCRIENGVRNQCKVQVTAFEDNKEIGQREVPFRFRYQCRKAVTKTAVSKGEILSNENVIVETGISDYPEPPRWTAPYGLVANRSLAANTVITETMVSSPQPEVLIKRNQSVAIKIENAGLAASAVGKAMQDGAAGEYIKVQNIDSKIIIMAKVHEDGTVEPIF